jgi:hypothetical protein
MAETAGGIYYPTKEDAYNLEHDLPEMSKSVEARLTASKGKLLIAQNTGAAAWEAMKGDATLAEDGTLTLQSTGGHFFSAAELTRTGAAYGAFSTPVEVNLPKVIYGQWIDVLLVCWARASSGGGGTLAMKVGEKEGLVANGVVFSASEWQQFWSNGGSFIAASSGEGLTISEAARTTKATALGAEIKSFPEIIGGATQVTPMTFSYKAGGAGSDTNVKVSLQGKAVGGMALKGVYLAAHVRG